MRLLLLVAFAFHAIAAEDAPPWAPVTVTVLGLEFTDGPAGPPLPVVVGATDGAGGWRPLFADRPVARGQVEVTTVPDAGGLVLRAGSVNGFVTSDGRGALVLRGGERLGAFLAMNGVRAPFGSQRPVAATVSRFLEDGDRVVLAENQVLVLFELGTTDPANAACDYQDAVLLVSFADPRAVAAIPRRELGMP